MILLMRRPFLLQLLGTACCAALAGCEPPPMSDNGVVGVIGELGLAPGQFTYPRSLAIDGGGRIYVVDKSARIQRFGPDGRFQTEWTSPESQAGKPIGLFADDRPAPGPGPRLFVADTHYHRVLVYDGDGHELARFGQEGAGDGQFILPTDVRTDAAGRIYVSEYGGNDRITRWTPDFQFDRVLTTGEIAGQPLRRPNAIDIDDDQTLWVADSCNHRVLRFDLDGQLLAAWGTVGREPGQMRYPYDIACLPGGEILVCEFGNSRLQWFDRQGHSRRTWGTEGRRLGQVWAPWGAAVAPDGRLYVLDSLNARVQIVRL